MIRLAAWYQEHLGPKSPVHIVFVSESEQVLERASKEARVKPQRLGQYLQNYLPKHPDLYELYESLAAIAEEDESADGSTPTGYEEVRRFRTLSGVFFLNCYFVFIFNIPLF